jgi:hypothetical protein
VSAVQRENMSMRQHGRIAAVALVALGLLCAGRFRIDAAPAGTIHYPDLQVLVPLDSFSIIVTSPTTREFRYTHDQANLGDGPFELRLDYDPTNDTARAFQRIYTHDASTVWSILAETPVVGRFLYHPAHGHYHVPFANFGLFQIAANGSVGAPVALSPKVGFCIADSVPVASIPHQGVFGYSGDNCSDPRSINGISVGWADLYDFHDDGQSIVYQPATIPDGEYWFRAVADPFNYFIEKNEANNITDIRLRITGTAVTVVAGPFHPDSTPPAVSLTAPTAGSVSGTAVTINANASHASGISSVQFLLDGNPLGAPDSAPPYTLLWNTTTVPDGSHDVSAQALTPTGFYGTSIPVFVTVANNGPPPPPPVSPVTISGVLVSNRSSSSATVTWTTNVLATSEVSYGLDSNYGRFASDVSFGTNHSIPLTGLTPSTTYHYQVTSRDGMGNFATAGDFIFTTPAVSDITCNLTAPVGGTLVSSIINVEADAFGTASIRGVQFLLDSAPLGAEDTLPPYAIAWDTRSVPNGNHVLSAVARDPTNNQATCAPVPVIVSNSGPSTVGLVAAFAFDENQGAVAADSTANANHGTISGATWTPFGRFGSALAFDGSNDIVTINDSNSLDLTNALTLEAWVYPTTLSGWRTALMKERPGGLAYALYAHDDLPRPAGYVNVGGNDRAAVGTTALPLNAWSHIATTYDGATLRLFVNAVQVGSTPVTGGAAVSANQLSIGGNTVWGEYFAGRLDEIRIYNRALAQPEIQIDMNARVTPGVIQVPSVIGLPQADAATQITGAGLSVGTVTSLNSSTVPVGRVISQSPIAGTVVPSGSLVDFVVSLGAAASPCSTATSNPITCENLQPGAPASVWDVSGAGDSTIQGFATDISIDQGQTVFFKISTPSTQYRLDIYRMGYYGGMGARQVATVLPSVSLPQSQPNCLTDSTTGLVDCGNWAVSASWTVPTTAVSGIYFAKVQRLDTGGASHIVFIVRDDDGHSDLLFQTSDTTWQAYNEYGGNSLYVGVPADRAYKVSYNRPFTTRADSPEDWVFNAEYPMVRWLEANGYWVSYSTGVDTDRRGNELLEHKAFLSVGHDEYWSGAQRTNVETARASGIHLAFFSGNEIFWKTRWENSISAGATPHRTLVSYKETHADAKIDPLPGTWTGTWRDPRFSPPADGGRPENALSGTIFMVNDPGTAAIQVPSSKSTLRFWRNTSIASLAPGAVATLPFGTLGYEWDEELDNGFRPPGLIRLSDTVVNGVPILQDYGSTYAPGTATHALTLYRHASGALVFGAGTVQWSWGLDSNHDRGNTAPNLAMQQATVNLFADMSVQPLTPQAGLFTAVASSDTLAPTSAITSPTANSAVPAQATVTISGTAADSGGGVVGGVEISVDGGTTWRRATGREAWTFAWQTGSPRTVTLVSRAVDDSGNMQVPTQAVTVTIGGVSGSCPCTIWPDSAVPAAASVSDFNAIEVGLKFRTSVAGFISGIRFYKGGAQNGGIHVGSLWSATGTLLGRATFTAETPQGWQEVRFGSPIAVNANTTYVVSYYAPTGGYAGDNDYFLGTGVINGPLQALADGADGGNGVYRYGPSGFPIETWFSTNYWVDVVFVTSVASDTTPPTVTTTIPALGGSGVPVGASVSATFSEDLAAATVTSTTFELRNASNMLVAATVTYSAATKTATLQATTALASSAQYTARVRGGTGGVTDLAGNPLTADYTWTFTTAGSASPGETPILVVTSAANPFSGYYAEILRAEGLNAFTTIDISQVTDTVLAVHDVVILGEVGLTTTQVTMFTNWVNSGGNLIAARPDKKLASLLGLADAGTTLTEGYLLVNTATAPGAGIATDYTWTFTTGSGSSGTNEWTVCASEGGVCAFTGTMEVRYGANGSYFYKTLSNGTACTNAVFGDPIFGTVKQCAIQSTVPTPPPDWTFCAAEGGVCAFTGTMEVRYGANGSYFYQTLSNGTACTNAVFGDPIPGTVKECAIRSTTTTPPPDWTFCAAEGGVCAFTGTMEVRYGANGSYFYKTLSDGTACTNAVFGDPIFGVVKSCSIGAASQSPPTVAATRPAAGAWDALVNGSITATFNGSVNPATIISTTFELRDASNTLVPASVTYSAETRTATLTPSTALAASAQYTARLRGGPGGIRDLAGNTLSVGTMQFHGAADRYTLAGASTVATLYSDATTATASPAVTVRSVGTSGGQAAAFTYDLARSVIYTRQGNPAWAGQERDGQPPIRPDDLFFGGGQANWVDFSKVAIPQADEQQRLLANLIQFMNTDRKPIPRFWYLPRGLKAVVVMTGDDHGNNGTQGRFDIYQANSPAGCSIIDWQCVRATSYIYPSTPITASQAAAYVASGFEIAAHINTGCANYTPSSLAATYSQDLAALAAAFPGLPAPKTNRTHCVVWSDYSSQPAVALANGIRFDTNYYYYPASWLNNVPGMFTGSGMPMRFARADGTIMDVYQATTQMTDESQQTYPYTINALLNRALGPEGYYGVFTANMHTDDAIHPGSEAIVASAKARGVPIVSSLQMLQWLDGRNASSFRNVTWSGTTLSFAIDVGAGANGLQALLPARSASGTLTIISRGGVPVSYTLQTIKGIEYAVFTATAGAYQATYGSS